ncbi:MAG: type II secretion system F family protein [Candidatus Cloacimonetes bacterium]|nr:type II secretion system F family protein [Candidatus Cloacimonadota bacterium]
MSKCKALNPQFLEKLAELLRSRVPLRQALSEISEVEQDLFFRTVLERVESGEPLSEGFLLALGGKDIVARGLYRILQAGENHARLEEALIEGSQWLKKFARPGSKELYALPKNFLARLKKRELIIIFDPLLTAASLNQSLMQSGILASEPMDLRELMIGVQSTEVSIINNWILNAELLAALRQVLWMQSVIFLLPAQNSRKVQTQVLEILGEGWFPRFYHKIARKSE